MQNIVFIECFKMAVIFFMKIDRDHILTCNWSDFVRKPFLAVIL
jgi:hypothetical protein